MAKAGRVPGVRSKETLAENAARVIAFRLEELLSWRAALGDAEAVSDLHNMRIAAKRLRYALEALREVLGPETAPLVERVVALQDALGALHDADVAAARARAFLTAQAAGLPAPTIEAVGRYLSSREREVARLRRSLPVAWRPIVAPTFRRGLGRAVSTL